MAEFYPSDWDLFWRDGRQDEHPEHDIFTRCWVCIEEQKEQ